MTYQTSWEGHVRQPGWVEFTITLNNEGADWAGELRLTDRHNEIIYQTPVELPAHSNKRYRIPFFAKNVRRPHIILADQEGSLQDETVTLRDIMQGGRLCVAMDGQGLLLDRLAHCDTKLWYQDVAMLPETPMAWDSVDVLILNGISTADLAPAQHAALVAWVSAGGHLIVAGGAALPQTLTPLDPALRIADIAGTEILDLDLEGTVATGTVATGTAAATLTPRDSAHVLHEQGGKILAARDGLGQGQIDLIGWELASLDDAAWLAELWRKDPHPAVHTIMQQALSSSTPSSAHLLEIPIATAPRLWPWLLVFPIYILVMGPGTMIVVRRLKKPVLTWVLLPIWIVTTLLLLALGLNGSFARTFPLVREMAFITSPGHGLPARVVQGTAIYAPQARRLRWQATGAPRPMLGNYLLESGWYNEGAPFQTEVRNLGETASIAIDHPVGVVTWGSEGLYTSPEIDIRLRLKTSEAGTPVISGTLQSPVPLRDVTLIFSDGEYALPLAKNVAAGESAKVNHVITQTYRLYGGYQNLCRQESRYVGRSYAPYMSAPVNANLPLFSCAITARMDGVPFPAQDIGGTHIAESCLIYTVPCPTRQPSARALKIPLVNDPAETRNGWAEDQTGIIHISLPATTVAYKLPDYIHMQHVNQLNLTLASAYASTPYSPTQDLASFEIWNWESDRWEAQPLVELADPLTFSGDQLAAKFDIDKGLRMQITPATTSGGAVRITITVEGEW